MPPAPRKQTTKPRQPTVKVDGKDVELPPIEDVKPIVREAPSVSSWSPTSFAPILLGNAPEPYRSGPTHEQLKLLRAPFDAVQFKIQANTSNGAIVVAYIDARLVSERLNLVIGGDWEDTYEYDENLGIPGQPAMRCFLKVMGITRSDVGNAKLEEYKKPNENFAKGILSDAFKRAAVKWGIGVSLYATPRMYAELSDCLLKTDGTPKGLKYSANKKFHGQYLKWLKDYGIDSFGAVISHGDSVDAAGDTEVATPVVESDPTEQAITTAFQKVASDGVQGTAAEPRGTYTGPFASPAMIKQLKANCNQLGVGQKAAHAIVKMITGSSLFDRIPASAINDINVALADHATNKILTEPASNDLPSESLEAVSSKDA